jgi:hypothetical protein
MSYSLVVDNNKYTIDQEQRKYHVQSEIDRLALNTVIWSEQIKTFRP